MPNNCEKKIKTNKNAQKNANPWLRFKAMNALNASKCIEEVALQSVNELVKLRMSEK